MILSLDYNLLQSNSNSILATLDCQNNYSQQKGLGRGVWVEGPWWKGLSRRVWVEGPWWRGLGGGALVEAGVPHH